METNPRHTDDTAREIFNAADQEDEIGGLVNGCVNGWMA